MKENGNLIRFEKNPITMLSLSDSSLTRDEETIETYSELLEAVDFDRVIMVCKFACIDVKNEDCDKNDFFQQMERRIVLERSNSGCSSQSIGNRSKRIKRGLI